MPKKTAVPPRKKTLAWSLVNTAAKEFRLEMQNQSSVFAIKAFRTSGNKIEGRVDRGICCADIGKAEKHSLSAVTAGASEHRVTMLKIGKLAQQGIAAASYLAQKYDEEGTRVSAMEIADARELPRPVVAKILAALSMHGITTGTTGPHGGYRLARPPRHVTLHDIVAVFERMARSIEASGGHRQFLQQSRRSTSEVVELCNNQSQRFLVRDDASRSSLSFEVEFDAATDALAAVRTVIVADAVMSIDNVVAVAAAALMSFPLYAPLFY